jgi:hypothetical protein
MGILDDLQRPTCSNCHWWVAASGGQVGECHHRSPNKLEIHIGAVWPVTATEHFCGDHQPAGND